MAKWTQVDRDEAQLNLRYLAQKYSYDDYGRLLQYQGGTRRASWTWHDVSGSGFALKPISSTNVLGETLNFERTGPDQIMVHDQSGKLINGHNSAGQPSTVKKAKPSPEKSPAPRSPSKRDRPK